MNGSLIALFVWLLTANVLAMIPSKDNHWRRAYGLIGLGVPLLVWVFWENPVWVGLLALLAGMSVLRWPVIYLGRWVRRKAGL
ncbi:DUF2484 family protein [Marimonas arenosa]|uniref:DUF2484 family protein n=1 Tax=Marimonas arenosa TaxID=1795305 RepID=A0AAE3WH98_9RHOB|nr:DUF2484 family protein [Marimonas arenosa]MDQ2091573.1 DUF2484 family protein [Marimonas arenosa]